MQVVYAASSTCYGNSPVPQYESQLPDLITPYAVSKHQVGGLVLLTLVAAIRVGVSSEQCMLLLLLLLLLLLQMMMMLCFHLTGGAAGPDVRACARPSDMQPAVLHGKQDAVCLHCLRFPEILEGTGSCPEMIWLLEIKHHSTSLTHAMLHPKVYGPRQPLSGAYATVNGIFLRQVSPNCRIFGLLLDRILRVCDL